jgi:hypothetical protein
VSEKPKLPTKYFPFVERLATYGDALKGTMEKSEQLNKIAGEDVANAEMAYNKKRSEERFWLSILAHDIRIVAKLDQLILILLQENLSLMEQLTTFISGHEEVRIKVRRNIEKQLKLWTETMEAGQKAREAYTK